MDHDREVPMKPTVELDTIFQALADPTRRRILGMLRRGERSTGDLAGDFPVTRPAVSRHLRVLYDAGLVDRRKEGRNQIYSLSPEPLVDARAWLDRYTRHWKRSLDALKAHVERDAGRDGPTPLHERSDEEGNRQSEAT